MENPNYYAIIPANVRYSKINSGAKLLYGEITALSNKQGFCYASNSYFAELYGVSQKTISYWVHELIRFKFIKSVIVYKENSKEIKARHLSIVFNPMHENVDTLPSKSSIPYTQKCAYPMHENVIDNNTSINTTINTTINNNVRFFEFWDLYDKKINQKGCLAKWNKLKNSDIDKIFETLPNYLKSIKDKQFQANPLTYLNQERWNDIIADIQTKKKYTLLSVNGRHTYEYTDAEVAEKTKSGFWKIEKIH